MNRIFKGMVSAALTACAGSASAVTFETETIQGSFNSTITTGIGVRTQGTSCGLVTRDSSAGLGPGGGPIFTGNPGPTGSGAPAGCTEAITGLGDQGNLNYKKGDAFTTYLKGSHELLLKMPENVTFMARMNWLKDFSATHASGLISAGNPTGRSQPHDASDDLSFKARLLDLWVSKEFSIGEERARVRVGNQVISWGESLFLPGGINQINAMDYMRLSQPGTQLKEVFLPSPIVSFATGLGRGLNMEAYYQAKWDENYLPPTGSYWSFFNGMGKGHSDYSIAHHRPKNQGQYGAALRWQPEGSQINLGAYAMRYNDKMPQFSYGSTGSAMSWEFPEDRKMYGVSANFPLGDWAVGTELSYRPKDAVPLSGGYANSGSLGSCLENDGKCWADEKRFQWHLTGFLSLTPSDYPWLLNMLGGADTGTLLAEAVMLHYPGLKRSYHGIPIAAGGWIWGNETDLMAPAKDVGDKTSWGYNLDFSWTYDGKLIPGWQVTPEVYFFHAVNGRSPNAAFMEGAKSANFIVTFTQNPANWQIGVNYAKFWGGKSAFDQLYADRDFVGAYISRNF